VSRYQTRPTPTVEATRTNAAYENDTLPRDPYRPDLLSPSPVGYPYSPSDDDYKVCVLFTNSYTLMALYGRARCTVHCPGSVGLTADSKPEFSCIQCRPTSLCGSTACVTDIISSQTEHRDSEKTAQRINLKNA